MPRRVLQRQLNSPSAVILPDELIIEIISWLPVKSLIQFRCVNKFFKTIIFDPHFVQMHFNKSSRNSHLALTHLTHLEGHRRDSNLVTLSIPHLLQNQNQFTSFHKNLRIKERIVGSCNGLLCLIGNLYQDNSIYFLNPAMRTKSEYFSICLDSKFHHFLKYSFGYDNFTCTYKVVAFGMKMKYDRSNLTNVVKVFSLGNNCWRDIQCFPMLPLYWRDPNTNNGVHLNGTINWLAEDGDYICSNNGFWSKDSTSSVVIVSLDLSTETYTQLLLPQGFEKVQGNPPKLVVLMDCLCSCRDLEETHFVIWKMKDFGVQESWIQLFKISYENFCREVDLMPLYLSKNGDTLILANDEIDQAFMYNRRDDRVEEFEISITNYILWSQAKEYAESLVSIH